MDDECTVLADMMKTHGETAASIIALSEFPLEEISSYGCVDPEFITEQLVRIGRIVEKPAPADAPSNLAVMGRYIFTPGIFDALSETRPGVGGEIQLTDAIELLLHSETVHGWVFTEGRFDVGRKIDYLRATVELAIVRGDLGDEFREYLIDLVQNRLS
jgi:UTP--glucose-1-phosphate uridylyltransferase